MFLNLNENEDDYKINFTTCNLLYIASLNRLNENDSAGRDT